MTTPEADGWLMRKPESPAWVRAALLGLLLLYGAVAWWLFGDGAIGSSWRECDTQAMARSLRQDFDLLHPRVDWRGATDGGVECEFPLYQGGIAMVLAGVGDVEWPGRLLSLIATLAAAAGWFGVLQRRSGAVPALIGVTALLASAQTAFIGTRVMPDATSTAFAVGGLACFAGYVQRGDTWRLALASLLTLLGVLVKPTAAQVVPVQFVWLWLFARTRLRDVRPWLAWGVVVVGAAAWVLHARALGQSTGLTFGVTFGDTKMPAFDHLLRPSLWRGLVATTAVYGLSWFGIVALAWLVVRRRFDRADAALLGVVGAGLVGSLRYSHLAAMGPQYHVWSAILGSWFVARAWPIRAGRSACVVACLLLAGNAALFLQREQATRAASAGGSHLETAATLQRLSEPTDLVVVRGPKPRFDPFWRRPNNFEEPVLLYQSQRKGWVLPVDGVDPETLTAIVAQGGRWYVDQGADVPTATAEWLSRHGQLAASPAGARIFRLRRE